uniref:DNA topoisomerase (ATP-hydrolyzing) n=1 Tax=Angiostrongylus cantonensis TaxID=6313 RepID=A0A0K0D502_ANGCA
MWLYSFVYFILKISHLASVGDRVGDVRYGCRYVIENLLQFIELVISGNIRPHERHLHELQNEMREMGFEDDPVKKWKGEKADLSYLTNMPMSRLTVSEMHEFRVQLNSIYEKLNRVAEFSWQDAWLTDLQVLEKELKNSLRYEVK